jgi:predicted ATPase/class 3 adenylate cyclase
MVHGGILALHWCRITMAELPTGTITFLFTDIEGSTRLLRELSSQYAAVLERHNALIRNALELYGGIEIRTEGDAFFCVFSTAPDGLAAAIDIQRSMAAEDWADSPPVRVRIGVHTGVAALGGDDYVGLDVDRTALISETGHGGQVVVSAATRMLGEAGLPDGTTFLDLGEVHLKDLDRPEHLFQLVIEGLESTFPPLRKLDAGPTNLPTSESSLIGRERERQEVEELLVESRLVTITGVAGAGKSRLALEVATNARHAYPDGVWLVELATLTSDSLVAQAVSHTMGLQESSGRVAADVLIDYLQEGDYLLVLDSCERVLDGVRELAGRLATAAPGLRILATSRQVLAIGGETRYPCPPLATPEVAINSQAEVLGFESVALFEARAREVDPTFSVNDENAANVAAICRRLDGMPLAIELAAALVRVLTPREILGRLDHRFELLTGGPRTAPPHQQTLLAALDATFELLDDSAQDFAMRLGVFVGGFDAGAAEEVTSGGDIAPTDVLFALSSLVDRSLITSTPAGGELRLSILESVRQYLLARLEASGQLAVRQAAHAKHFGGLVEAASTGLRGPDQEVWAQRLEADIENVRSAIAFTAAQGDETVLQFVNHMFLYWRERGDWSDGLHSTRMALEGTQQVDSGLRARILSTAGFFASDLGDGVRGIANLEEGLAMARRSGDLHAEGFCSSFLGAELSRRDTDLDRGLALLSDAQRIYEELSEPYGEAWVNRYLALSYQERGDLDESIRLHTLSLEAFRQSGDIWNTRFAQTLSGEAMHTIAELSRSRELYNESLRGSSDARFTVVIAHAHKGLGKVSLAEGNLDEASDHLGEALRELGEIGDVACVAESKGHLAMVNLGRGHPVVANDLLTESLSTFREIEDKGGVAWSLERLAAVSSAIGSHERAAQLLGAGSAIRARHGSKAARVDQPDLDRLVFSLTEHLGYEELNAAMDIGANFDLDGVVALDLN